MTPEALDELSALAMELADAARDKALVHFRNRNLIDENKAETGFDPVTEADRAAEAAMRDILARRRPQDGILGEEFGTQAGDSGLQWILDPIDGTRAYISGTPTWGVLVALADETGPLIGIIDQPYIGERFFGRPDGGWVEGPMGRHPLATRGTDRLAEATIFTTFPEVGSEEEGRKFHSVAQACRLTRYGMDCYAYGLLAAGHVDLVIEAGLAPYDICAPIAVIQAAGGQVTDWNGGSAAGGGRVLAAANPALAGQAMDLLSAG